MVCGHLAGLTKEHNFVCFFELFLYCQQVPGGQWVVPVLTQAIFCFLIAIMKERKDAEKAGSGQSNKRSAGILFLLFLIYKENLQGLWAVGSLKIHTHTYTQSVLHFLLVLQHSSFF